MPLYLTENELDDLARLIYTQSERTRCAVQNSAEVPWADAPDDFKQNYIQVARVLARVHNC